MVLVGPEISLAIFAFKFRDLLLFLNFRHCYISFFLFYSCHVFTHVTCGDDTDQLITDSEDEKENSCSTSMSESIEPKFILQRMLRVMSDHQWMIEEYLLTLSSGLLVLEPVLLGVSYGSLAIP